MHDVVEARTAKSPGEGFALLQNDLWLTGNEFHAGVRGYLNGLPAGSDWLEVRERVGALIPERVARTVPPEKADEQESKQLEIVDLSVARAWAQDNLGAAVDWYARELTSDGWLGPKSPRVVQVLQAVSMDEMSRVGDWVDAQRRESGWDDQIVVQFMHNMRGVRPNADFEHLVSTPQREEDRARIIAGFATPAERDGKQVLRHPPEALNRLIRAAHLSAEETDRWLRTVENASWPQS